MAFRRGSDYGLLPVFAGRTTADPFPDMMQSARNFVPRSNRWFDFTIAIDMGNLMTLGARMEAAIHDALVIRMAEAANKVLTEAKMRLQPGHGYDTGRMHDALTARLVSTFEDGAVAYSLEAGDEAPYWVFVEFGHMTRGGSWWAGYHFLTGAVMDNQGYITNKANQAIRDAIGVLAIQDAAMARFFPSGR